jgi:signal transduction histidine kinase
MAEAELPKNEEQRRRALYSYDLLDRDVDPVFDNIIRIAADVCDVDISVIALIDHDRQYFLARNNMKPRETPRAIAFCAHAILEPHTTFEIENATTDPRFKDNPLVTGEIGVRFYAAHPLTTTEGHALGGLCLIGKKPKKLNDVQRNTLRNLADIIMTLFEARKAELKAANQLIVAKEVAEAANNAKSQFLSSMNHELRTPLNSIIGYSQLLQHETFGPLGHEKYNQYIDSINLSGNLLHSLIGDILDISKIDAGEMIIDAEDIQIENMLDECIKVVSSRSEHADITLSTEIAQNLPTFSGDELRIKQIVLNLLSNAIKFTPKGGRVLVRSNINDKGGLMISIDDTGIGIASSNIAKVLEPFSQVRDHSAQIHEGTGLGLTLSKSLTELHGGTLTIDSKLGKGTSVTLHFPPERTISD